MLGVCRMLACLDALGVDGEWNSSNFQVGVGRQLLAGLCGVKIASANRHSQQTP
jgi:hypothetical protein